MKNKRFYAWILIVVIIVFQALFLFSCDIKNTKDTAEINADNNKTEASVTRGNRLSEILMYKIAKGYFITCQSEFEANNTVPFSEVFKYFQYSAIYSFDESCVNPMMEKYYDKDSNMFYIPHQIVDDYLSSVFNTVPDPEDIDCYQKESECYVFGELISEFYYYTDIDVDWKSNEEGAIDFTVSYIHSMMKVVSDTIKYSVQMTDNGYRILSVKWLFKGNLDEGISSYTDQNWECDTNTYSEPVVKTIGTAYQIAKSVFDGLSNEISIKNYYYSGGIFDDEDEIWVISFQNTSKDSNADRYYIAMQKIDGKVVKIWHEE